MSVLPSLHLRRLDSERAGRVGEAHVLKLAPHEIEHRAEVLVARLASCDLCPRACGVDRTSGAPGRCRTGTRARVSAAFPHFGEEAVLVGRGGSGTVFFCGCSLGCSFCQNIEISHGNDGREVDARELAGLMLGLEAAGCVNVNLVTPSHVAPAILSALAIAARAGFNLPVVWNSSGYDSVETLRALEGVVDVYLPDLKSLSPEACDRWMRATDYPAVAEAAIREMHRQVGDLVVDADGVARRGLLVRHLVMPGAAEDSARVMRLLARIAPGTRVNVMDQYRPVGGTGLPWELRRRPSATEVAAAMAEARAAGLVLL